MCKVNSDMVVADGAAVGQALENLAEAMQANDPTVAADLKAAGVAVVAATSGWKEGDALTDVEDAENAAIAVLDVIPVTSTFAPLVAIVFAGLNLLISNSKTQAVQTPAASLTNVKALLATSDALHTDSPWKGKAELHHNPMKSIRKNFEDSFNEKAAPLNVKPVTV